MGKTPKSPPPAAKPGPLPAVEPFRTTDLRVTDYLNQQGIHPVGSSGSPMTFVYAIADLARIEAHREQIAALLAQAAA